MLILKVKEIKGFTKEYYEAGKGWVTYTYNDSIYLLEGIVNDAISNN